jgi:hypothetical protein
MAAEDVGEKRAKKGLFRGRQISVHNLLQHHNAAVVDTVLNYTKQGCAGAAHGNIKPDKCHPKSKPDATLLQGIAGVLLVSPLIRDVLLHQQLQGNIESAK